MIDADEPLLEDVMYSPEEYRKAEDCMSIVDGTVLEQRIA